MTHHIVPSCCLLRLGLLAFPIRVNLLVIFFLPLCGGRPAPLTDQNWIFFRPINVSPDSPNFSFFTATYTICFHNISNSHCCVVLRLRNITKMYYGACAHGVATRPTMPSRILAVPALGIRLGFFHHIVKNIFAL